MSKNLDADSEGRISRPSDCALSAACATSIMVADCKEAAQGQMSQPRSVRLWKTLDPPQRRTSSGAAQVKQELSTSPAVRDYWQVSEAVPLTVIDVFCTPLLTVKLRFSGALAVMVTVPGAEQVTSPVEPIVAATAPEGVGEVFHVRPSTCESSRLLPFAKFPVAV